MDETKRVFYLPLRDTDGRDLRGEIEELLAEVYIRFAGWTFQGYVKGAYRMADGTQALDDSAAYIVVLDESEVEDLANLLGRFKSRTLQEAIYLEIQWDVEVRFV